MCGNVTPLACPTAPTSLDHSSVSMHEGSGTANSNSNRRALLQFVINSSGTGMAPGPMYDVLTVSGMVEFLESSSERTRFESWPR